LIWVRWVLYFDSSKRFSLLKAIINYLAHDTLQNTNLFLNYVPYYRIRLFLSFT
jgi:hypothetical protein